MTVYVKKVKPSIALNGKLIYESYGASLAIWDHTVLPAARHKWKAPCHNPSQHAGTWFTYPGRMEGLGWVDLGSLIAAQPGIEPTTACSQVRRPNCYATESPEYVLVITQLQTNQWQRTAVTDRQLDRMYWTHTKHTVNIQSCPTAMHILESYSKVTMMSTIR